MITITLTGKDAEDYIYTVQTTQRPARTFIPEVDNGEYPFEMSDVARTPQPLQEEVEIDLEMPPVAKRTIKCKSTKRPEMGPPTQTVVPPKVAAREAIKQGDARKAHFKAQAEMQDELEKKNNLNGFPTPKTIAKPIPVDNINPAIKPNRKKPFKWKPYHTAIKSIMKAPQAQRTLQRVINVLQPIVVSQGVLRDKLMREGITYDYNTGLLMWRTDGFDHSKKGFKNV